MKIEKKAANAGDRKKPAPSIPSATAIYSSSACLYETTPQLDRVMGREEEGYSYARYDNPTNVALEELMTALESGQGALACSSGMNAIHTALLGALLDRRKSIVASNALYGATVSLLTKVLDPLGVETSFVDICDLAAVQHRIEEQKPGCVLMETVSNPLLRVGDMGRVAGLARANGAALVVYNTFATPLLVRTLELAAHIGVHSLTKFLAVHGDVLGGAIVADEEHTNIIRTLSRTVGPVLGPFECYLTMRRIKTFPLRM